MKILFTLSGLFFAGLLSLSAQHESLFGDASTIGAFGGPILEFSQVNGQLSADVGGGGALILDEFFIGGYGMGTDYPELSLTEEVDGELQTIDYDIQFGHGGLWFGYVKDMPKKSHLYSSLKVGWGKAELEHDRLPGPSDRIFVLTPEVGVELNMTRFFKIALSGGYRIVSGVGRIPTLDNGDFSSPTGTITFRFGGFGSDFDWE